mgnify:CR=1 FL=1
MMEGIVTIPPFGYFKDKNTKKVVIVEEAAETVCLIFTAYVGGSCMKTIVTLTGFMRRFWIKLFGIMRKSCGSNMQLK